MSVLTTFLVAPVPDAVKLIDNATHQDYPLFECRNVGEDDISDLLEALEDIGLAHPFETGVELLETEDDATGPWVFRVEPHLVTTLAGLGPANISKAAQEWARVTNHRVKHVEDPDPTEVEDFENLLKELCTIARLAKSQRAAKHELLLWVSA